MERLAQRIKKMTKLRIVRALTVGVVAVSVQTIVFELVGVIFKLTSVSSATVIGAEFGILTNFFLNNKFSFGDRKVSGLASRIGKFHLVVSGAVFIQWLSLFIAERVTTDLLILHVVYASSIIVSFAWNYTWYKVWVWKQHSSLNEKLIS